MCSYTEQLHLLRQTELAGDTVERMIARHVQELKLVLAFEARISSVSLAQRLAACPSSLAPFPARHIVFTWRLEGPSRKRDLISLYSF